jgi:hypothetical protein
MKVNAHYVYNASSALAACNLDHLVTVTVCLSRASDQEKTVIRKRASLSTNITCDHTARLRAGSIQKSSSTTVRRISENVTVEMLCVIVIELPGRLHCVDVFEELGNGVTQIIMLHG